MILLKLLLNHKSRLFNMKKLLIIIGGLFISCALRIVNEPWQPYNDSQWAQKAINADKQAYDSVFVKRSKNDLKTFRKK